MQRIPIDRPEKRASKEFRELLKKNIMKLASERRNTEKREYFYEEGGINNAITTIRVSIGTKKKLNRYLRPRETYEELIRRLVETNDSLKEENSYLREFENDNKYLIKYVEQGFKRAKKTYNYHPDLKIEYSYNESKVKSIGNFSFNLEIDNFILQGKPITDWEGIKTVQIINILKSLKKTDLNSDVDGIIKMKELMLESREDFIKTKYLIYFKILFFIINKKIDQKISDINVLNLDFWKELYDSKNLYDNSLEGDVIQKLKKFELELEQVKTDRERKSWNIKLKG